MTIKDLLSVLIVERSNMQVIHWKAKGRGFDTIHNNVTSSLYDEISDDIDVVAELGMRIGVTPVNYMDALRFATKSTPSLKVYSAEEDYDRERAIELVDNSLKNIHGAILSVLTSDEIANDVQNYAIKIALEGLYEKYDKEYRFLNQRRKDA